ncbi:hypothetical protein RRG08_011063 [Elysia crispata]|uniref:Uncharacterized protein n=1 Tax=Elysia crispata TaxID=231223 RepID=A0AAE0Z9T8_9GAST|nr:hypothetical protein RRG08_011063 [Elysia crispata]
MSSELLAAATQVCSRTPYVFFHPSPLSVIATSVVTHPAGAAREARSATAECGGLARLFSSLPPQLEPLHVSGVLGAHRSIVSSTVLAIKFNSIVSFSIKPGSGKIPMFHQSNFPFKFRRGGGNQKKKKKEKKNTQINDGVRSPNLHTHGRILRWRVPEPGRPDERRDRHAGWIRRPVIGADSSHRLPSDTASYGTAVHGGTDTRLSPQRLSRFVFENARHGC